jgi:transposase
MAEGQKLARIGRTAKDPVKLRRAIVVLMSAQGQSVPDIAELMQVGADYVRDVIHAFNERGFDALDPKWSGGRPRAIDSGSAGRICAIAKADPRLFGLPWTTSLRTNTPRSGPGRRPTTSSWCFCRPTPRG